MKILYIRLEQIIGLRKNNVQRENLEVKNILNKFIKYSQISQVSKK